MHRNKLILIIKLKYIQNLAFSKYLSCMCESVSTMYDPDNLFLLTVKFLTFFLLALLQAVFP